MSPTKEELERMREHVRGYSSQSAKYIRLLLAALEAAEAERDELKAELVASGAMTKHETVCFTLRAERDKLREALEDILDAPTDLARVGAMVRARAALDASGKGDR